MTARVDHALRMGQRGSLRAWPVLATGDAVVSVTWTQTEGPAVLDLDTTEPQLLLFNVPAVERDTRLRFRATLTTKGGTMPTATKSASWSRHCRRRPAGSCSMTRRPSASTRIAPRGPMPCGLVDCVYSPELYFGNGATNLCTLSQLPLLAAGATDGVPSVEAIMDRVLGPRAPGAG